LTIWTNYGISVIENQSVPFLEKHGYQGQYTLIKLTLLALYLSFIPAARRAREFPLALFALAAVIGEMAWTAIRNQTLLAFFSLSAIAINAGLGGFAHLMAARKKLVTLALGLIMLGSVYYNGREVWMRRQTGGLGLQADRDAAMKLLRPITSRVRC